MKTKYIYFVTTAVFAALFLSASQIMQQENAVDNKTIIKFSHQLHAESEVDCASCHSNVPESTSLSDRLLPEKDACAACHDVDDDDNCSTCHYEDVNEPLVQKKSELTFNHKFHISEQNQDCRECHKDFTEVAYSSELEHPNPTMNQCYTCHNDISVAVNVCESCHISTVDLVPEDHNTVSFFDNHKFTSMQKDANCEMCHDQNFCESCHVGTIAIDEKNTVTDFYTPYSTHRLTDNTKQQQITRVHTLDYRFTHGIDSKGKSSECQTCHQTETFCAECHSADGGDYALEGIVPLSHTQSNFTTFGVGSGGGQHAVLARRDIERCASCHDTQGADPSCILCHSDPDGQLNTNSRTHEKGFMSSNEGDWHNDNGSVCFNCHTDPFAMSKTKGQGFCGYCHK